jgi:alkylation response protein AidB-like acyl-CoA dehydrogenase
MKGRLFRLGFCAVEGGKVSLHFVESGDYGYWIEGEGYGHKNFAWINGRIGEPLIRERLAWCYERDEIMRLLGCRSLTAESRGEPIGPKTSLEKLFGSELSQRVRELAVDVLGPNVLLGMDDERAEWEGRWLRFYLFSRADTIMGGTSEVQRTVIAHQLLGLPR